MEQKAPENTPENKATEASSSACRDKKTGRLLPGVSGNPGGRPKIIREVITAEREHFGRCVRKLRRIFEDADEDSKVRISAFVAWSDRVIGKPKQSVELTGADGAPLVPASEVAIRMLTNEQLAGLVAAGHASVPEEEASDAETERDGNGGTGTP